MAHSVQILGGLLRKKEEQVLLFEMKVLIRLCEGRFKNDPIRMTAEKRLKKLSEIPVYNPFGSMTVRSLK